MEISQLLTPQGASPLAQNAKGDSGDGAKFAQLYQQAGHSTKSLGEANSSTAKDALTLLAGGNPLAKGIGNASFEKLLDKLDAGIEVSSEEASIIDAMVSGLPVPAELTPLAQQIATVIGSDIQAQTSALKGNTQASQSITASGTAGVQDEMPGLASIRQRLDLIAQAQQGNGVPADNESLTLANQGLGDGVAKRAFDNGAVRHQTLTAQNQSGAVSPTSALTQEGMTTTGTQPIGTFVEAIAAVGGNDAGMSGRGGSETFTSQGVLAAGTGVSGSSSQIAGQPQGISQPTLSAPLASPQWQQGLGQQLVSMYQRGDQRVELHLHPAELGPLSISLKLDDQLAQAQFSSANPQVRAAIEQAIPQLREALAESGIQLGEAMVGQHQQREGDQSAEQGGALLADSSVDSAASDESESSIMTPQSIDMNGRVNLYA